MKICKKLSLLAICVVMFSMILLSGCAYFPVDMVKYYSDVVATVGNEKITRFDLLSAYNSYGYSYYVSQLGNTSEEALSSTLDLLINRSLILQYIKNDIKESTDSQYKLNEYEVNEAWNDLFDYMDEQMENYTTEAKEILNIDDEADEEETTDEEETAYIYTPYKKRAKIVQDEITGSVKIVVEEEKTPTTVNDDELVLKSYRNFLTDYTNASVPLALKEQYFSNYEQKLTTETDRKVYNKALKLLSEDLLQYQYYLRDENGNKYSTKTEDMISWLFERQYESQLETAYFEKLQNIYIRNENLSVDKLTDKFKELYKADYDKYYDNESSYISKMTESGTEAYNVYYNMDTTSEDLFYVYHILFGYNDEQKSYVEDLDKKLENKLISQEKYDEEIEKLSNNVIASIRNEEGLDSGNTVSVDSNLFAQIKNKIDTAGDDDDKIKAFNELMYKYSTDTATLTSSASAYVIGTTTSSMVDSFTEASRNLYNDGQGKVGDLSGFVSSEYGLHLIMYAGKVENKFTINNIDNVVIDFSNSELNLYNMLYNRATNYTYFDMLFDKVYPAESDGLFPESNGYSDYETSLADMLKGQYKVTKYTDKIKGTLKV